MTVGQLFDKTGKALTEIRAIFERSWVLNDYGTCTFKIATSDSKCRKDYLAFGNHVVVPDDRLPDWCGVIVHRSWADGELTVTANGAEWILSKRPGPMEVLLNSAPGRIFRDILDYANAQRDTLIRGGVIFDGGRAREETLHPTPLLDDVKRVSERSGNDWGIEPEVVDGQLLYRANWYEQRGSLVEKLALEEGRNIERRDNILEEYGEEIENDILGYGDGATYASRVTSRAVDAESGGKYGWNAIGLSVDASEQATVDASTDEELKAKKEPKSVLALNALDVGELYSLLQLGNRFPALLKGVGFSGDGFGWNGTVRVTGMSYRADGKVDLTTEEYHG